MVVIFINLTTLDVHRWGLFVLAVALTGLTLLGFGLLLAGTFKNANQLNTWSGVFLPAFPRARPWSSGNQCRSCFARVAALLPSGAGMKLLLNSVATEQIFSGKPVPS